MIYDNNEITAITYSGYNIVRAYSCDKKLVFGNPPPPPVISYKVSLYMRNNVINVPCDEYDAVTSTDTHNMIDIGDVTSVIVRECVSEIGRDAFSSGTSITAVTIPDNITTINTSAFYECTSLTSLNIPSSVNYVGMWAFRNCSSLTNITFNSIEPPNFSTRIFVGCTSLQHIYVPQESLNAYKNIANLSEYSNLIEAIPI